ncbi:stemmadenine O-acetyltransferase-like [Gastrolobium bilobum]|uniref:stemmadenine O-acetyltransferase-like n=1 Tax=Gastrolobium bilobum TaxID=150636 RepID=UPI002AAFDE05|nr:stemmadenine O-acetyltransferase-like [Gastrolobium bilobum]
MKLEVDIISKEIIKPSSPTPHHLRHYQLSFLDQISPSVYEPTVLFYTCDGSTEFNITSMSNHLKKSLSDVLTHYYPFAGRINGKNFIDCNDEGIPYFQAKVKCKLVDVIHKPVPGELNHLVPFQLDDITDILFSVQLNVFECGGIAIGVCLSHQIADGLSFFTFINNWAAIANGSQDVLPNPQFVSAKLFPPKNISGFDPRSGIIKDNIICKMFVFDASVVENLRERYADTSSFENEKPPTRVEALSAFIWSRYVAVTRDQSSPQRTHAVVHAVNLRPKMEPPLPPESFGNYYRISMTIPSLNTEEECHGLVKRVRDQIKKIDKDYVRKLQEGNEHLGFLKDSLDRVLVKGELVAFNFTSLCRFPLYDADFGWGKPTWVGVPSLMFKNLVVFVDTKTDGGIEAYVSLKVEDMVKFEEDEELLACVNKARSS